MLAICFSEEIQVDSAPVDEGRSHIPVGDDHPHMTAMLTEDRGGKVPQRFRVEIAKIPLAGSAHRFFTTQFVQLQDESCFFLNGHEIAPLRIWRYAAPLRDFSRVEFQLNVLSFRSPAASAIPRW